MDPILTTGWDFSYQRQALVVVNAGELQGEVTFSCTIANANAYSSSTICLAQLPILSLAKLVMIQAVDYGLQQQ